MQLGKSRGISTVVLAIVIIVVIVVAGVAAYYFYSLPGGSQTSTGQTSTGQTSTGQLPAKIYIGDISDTTGCGALIGQQEQNGAELAVNEINANGGVLGSTLVLLKGNDNCDPTTAVTVATNMITQNNVVAIVGWSYTGQALAAQPVLMQHKVIEIGDSTGGVALIQNVTTDYQHFKYVFQGNYNTTGWAVQTATFMYKVAHAHSAYYVSEDYLWTHILWNSLQSLTKNITWGGHDFVDAAATDYSSEVAKIAAFKPDVIINLMGGTNQNIFARQRMSDPAVAKIPIFGTGILPMEIPNNVKSVDTALQGSTQYYNSGVDAWLNPNNHKSVTFLNSYGSTYHSFPDYSSAAFSYDAVYFVAAAITQTHSTNTDVLVNQMEHMTFQGITGTWQFDKSHSLKIGPGFLEGAVVQWVNINAQVVYPPALANATWVDPRSA